MRTTIDFGIDLGTTNSSIAVMNDSRVQVIRNSDGAEVTPSVVKVSADGAVVVGRRAKQVLELDPENTRAEFKRVMGITEEFVFPKSGKRFGPEALSAEVLKSLRADARDQLGEEVKAAVVTVPALFEIPQCEATARAAKLAGLELAPLLQEPIAAAIACGFREAGDVHGYWLVYDLGGGTFDTSLLLTRDGRMQVLDHDGDNFLGGKDFDWFIVDWAAKRLREEKGLVDFDRASLKPEVRRAFAKLKAAAEDAKILLSRTTQATLQVDELLPGVDASLTLTRQEYEALIAPRVQRTLEIVRGLLARNRVGESAVEKLIFVGGPTLTPALRAAVEDGLGLHGEAGVDPMTIVAQGAAIHAAAQRLPVTESAVAVPGVRRIQLEYPPISQEMEPFVVGKIALGSGGPEPAAVEVNARDGSFRSGRVPVSDRGGFAISLRLHKKGATAFQVRVYDAKGDSVPVAPDEFSITYGMIISEPPLSRSIGVATADNEVWRYVDKGTSLPARKTLTLKTAVALSPGGAEAILKVPVVQGESRRADRNRHIGTLEIPAANLRRSLPALTEVEVTIEVDNSGTVHAQAFVPLADQVFEQVLSIATPKADPEKLSQMLWTERGRLVALRKKAAESRVADAIALSRTADEDLLELEMAVSAAKGGDADAAQLAVRRLIDLQTRLDAIEDALKWPDLERDLTFALSRARMAVIARGEALERDHFAELEREAQAALEKRDLKVVEWKTQELHRLAWAIESRDPEEWVALFNYYSTNPTRFSNPAEAQKLFEKGREARDKEQHETLKGVVRSLWELLPPDEKERSKGYGSGVR
jgi:molecular chaperone DnaK